MFKSLQLLPTFNRDQKKYQAWKQKLGIIASLKPDNVLEQDLIKLVCTKFEDSAGNWIAMWIGSFPITGTPPTVQYPAEATTFANFVNMLDQKFISENVTRCYKEDFWNCKQGATENICTFIAQFDCLRMLNSTAGTQAVAMFEHSVQAQIFQLMQLQSYSGNSLTEAFRAAEKAADILGKGTFPLLANS